MGLIFTRNDKSTEVSPLELPTTNPDLIPAEAEPLAASTGDTNDNHTGEPHRMVLRTDNLVKKYGKRTVANHVSIDVKQGEIVGLLGPNGAGKTTTIGKMAAYYHSIGHKVLLAAADTFRAAAGEQLSEWANRAGVDMIGASAGSDPASVVFDAVNAAKARNADVLLCDTAGRLHNKKNLMEELKKINRIIEREFPNAHRENLVVLDGTTGQNALQQAREFGETANLTGIILTKMDGTSKGGIAVAIQSELNIPVKYIGLGEKIEDLQKFDAEEFIDALFDVRKSDDV